MSGSEPIQLVRAASPSLGVCVGADGGRGAEERVDVSRAPQSRHGVGVGRPQVPGSALLQYRNREQLRKRPAVAPEVGTDEAGRRDGRSGTG